jgi:hypothetical protein
MGEIYKCIKDIYYEGSTLCFTKGKTYRLRELSNWDNDSYYFCEKDDMGDNHELWVSQINQSFVRTFQPQTNFLKKHKLGETCEEKILEYF